MPGPALPCAALAVQVGDLAGKDLLQLSSHTLFKLLAALNECTEWGQVFILDSLVAYDTKDAKDAEKIVERVLPRLQHVNSAVVLSAVKVRAAPRRVVPRPGSVWGRGRGRGEPCACACGSRGLKRGPRCSWVCGLIRM